MDADRPELFEDAPRQARRSSLPSSRTRLLALAGASLLCALLAGLAALDTHGKSLPPTDGAYGIPAAKLLADPFVRRVWFALVALGAAVGFLLSVGLLWRVRLSRALPVVGTVTVLAAAATGPLSMLSGIAALGSGTAAMLWCRSMAAQEPGGPWAGPDPTRRRGSSGRRRPGEGLEGR